MVFVIPMGAASTVFIAVANALLQLRARPDMRGRVMALFSMVFLGTTPIGGLLVGWVSEQWGPRSGLALGGVASAVAGAAALTVLVMAARRIARGQIEVHRPDAVPARI
jgi:MFS family permease